MRQGTKFCTVSGTFLRILPNHACATAAQHDRYNVLPQDGGPIQTWPRFGGW